MKLHASVAMIGAALLAVIASAPAYAGHHHGFHPRHHHHYYRHHHNDWGRYLGLSTLFVLPEIIRQSQYQDISRYDATHYVPYANTQPAVSLTPVNQALAVTSDSQLDEHSQVNDAQESVADEVLRVANNGRDVGATPQQFIASSVRHLPANARVVQTGNGTEYEWQGQRYYYNWQDDMYVPLSR